MTPDKSAVCVLIPAYNEEKKIGSVIEAVRRHGFEVVAVDDGSTDGTSAAIKKSGAHCVVSPVNKGKGSAIRMGFDWALEHGYGAVIVVDADGQHAPGELEHFIRALAEGDADLVVGNRMTDPKGMSFVRRCTNRIMSWLISWPAGQFIPDTQCGYRALTRRALETLRLRTDRFEIESEMLMDAGRRGLRIKSIPVSSVYGDEVSHIRPFRDTLRFFKFFLKFILSRR